MKYLCVVLLLFSLVQDAHAARAKKPKLSCSSSTKGCVSCELTPQTSEQVQALLRLPNNWRLEAGRQRVTAANQANFYTCGVNRKKATVRLRIKRGRHSSSYSARVKVNQTDSPPPPPVAGVLQSDQFVYEGTALLPQNAVGNSTGFEVGLLGVRRVAGELRIFNDTHIYTTGALYEAKVSGFATASPFPSVQVVQELPNIYGQSRVDAAGTAYSSGPPVNGLLWDPLRQGLWWAYGEHYNTQNRDAASVGFTQFAGGGLSAQPALKLHEAGQANHWTRGCVVLIPQRYAELLGGRRLGAGCGGYYSIIAGGSWGPALTAFDPDHPSDRTVLLGYAVSSDTRAPRPGDYVLSDTAGSGSGWMGRNPVGDSGTWTGADEIGGEGGAGAALFVDIPAGRGVLFWASHGTGRLGYDAGAITSAGRKNRLYIYDPEKLLAVYRGERDRAIPPEAVVDWQSPAGFLEGRIGGVAQDPDDPSIFYVVQTMAYHSGVEYYPVLHRYRMIAR